MTVPDAPPLSVVVPIYNGGFFIVETIEAVRRQTCTNWELILCDNVSKDNTVKILEEYLAQKPDERIRFIQYKDHLPMAENWNRALPLAAGRFIKLLAADDILLPTCLETQARLLE